MNELVLDSLNKFKWEKTWNRKNIGPGIYSNILGWVSIPFTSSTSRFQLSKMHNDNSELFELLCKFIWQHDPNFTFSSITLNKNVLCPPHKDSNNFGYSYIIGLGNYRGGELIINNNKFDIHNKWLKFNGHDTHWTEFFTGDRYTIVYYTLKGAPCIFSLNSSN